MNDNERYSRQRDIAPPERRAACPTTVIGVGAISRQVALQLTATGVPWLQYVDFDEAETGNLASQGYLEAVQMAFFCACARIFGTVGGRL